jgi:hypothetical protein
VPWAGGESFVRRGRFLLVVLVTVAIGVMLRTLTLYVSPLPFNPDGVVYAGHVRDAGAAGHLPLANLEPDALHFTAFLAVITEVTGVEALSHAQGVVAVVGTLPALFLASVGRRLGVAVGLDASRARFVGGLAGLTLAVEGLYLHRSIPVDEQTVGLFLVPLALVAVAYAGTRDRRWWVVAVASLVALPAVHNLDAFVAALALTLLAVVATQASRLGAPRTYVALAAGYWVWFVAYTIGVKAFTPATVIQQSRLTDVPDLVLAWLVLVAVGLVWYVGQRARVKRALLSTVLCAWFVVLGVNAVTPVFPGLPGTNPTILYGIAPLVVLVGLFAVAVPRAADVATGRVLVTLVAGIAVVVGVSLTAALTAEYLNTLYRVQTFAHFPVVGIAALGGGLLVMWGARDVEWVSPRGLAGVLVCVVLVASVASIPIAYGGLDVLPYKGVTTPAELKSSGFAGQHVEGAWTSDDHLVRIGRYHRSAGGSVGPTYAFLTGGGAPGCPMLSQDSWTTVGGQLYPRDPAVVSPTRYAQLGTERHVVYASGVTDRIALTVPRGTGTGC